MGMDIVRALAHGTSQARLAAKAPCRERQMRRTPCQQMVLVRPRPLGLALVRAMHLQSDKDIPDRSGKNTPAKTLEHTYVLVLHVGIPVCCAHRATVPRHPRASIAVVSDKAPPALCVAGVGMASMQQVGMEVNHIACPGVPSPPRKKRRTMNDTVCRV